MLNLYIGYTVLPLRGYLSEKGTGLFEQFFTHMYDNRTRARKSGNAGNAYVYKIPMNSLYGRFGINPRSTTTQICYRNRYEYLFVNSQC